MSARHARSRRMCKFIKFINIIKFAEYLGCAPFIRLQAEVNELIALQGTTRAELDALLPSVLDRAFRGEL